MGPCLTKPRTGRRSQRPCVNNTLAPVQSTGPAPQQQQQQQQPVPPPRPPPQIADPSSGTPMPPVNVACAFAEMSLNPIAQQPRRRQQQQSTPASQPRLQPARASSQSEPASPNLRAMLASFDQDYQEQQQLRRERQERRERRQQQQGQLNSATRPRLSGPSSRPQPVGPSYRAPTTGLSFFRPQAPSLRPSPVSSSSSSSSSSHGARPSIPPNPHPHFCNCPACLPQFNYSDDDNEVIADFLLMPAPDCPPGCTCGHCLVLQRQLENSSGDLRCRNNGHKLPRNQQCRAARCACKIGCEDKRCRICICD